MKLEKRPPLCTDQDETDKAYRLIQMCMEMYPDIEPTLWMGALTSRIVDGCINCGIKYPQFCEMMEDVKEHYRKCFDE